MLICIVARNCSWIGLGLMFETLLLAWQHMLSQRNAYATYRTMFTSYFSMRVPDTRRTDSCSSAVFSHYLVDVLRAHLPYLTYTALSVTRNHYQLHRRRTDFTVRLALSDDIMEPITTDGLEYPVSKRRRTTTLVSKKQSMDVRTYLVLLLVPSHSPLTASTRLTKCAPSPLQ